MATPSTEYVTTDTAQAAYLISQGHDLLQIRYGDFNASFVFSDNDPQLAADVKAFLLVQAVGNIVVFNNTFKNLVHRIRDRLP